MNITDLIRPKKDAAPQKPVLEQVAEHDESGGVTAGVTKMIEGLLDVGIDGKGPFTSAQLTADRARLKHGDTEKAIDGVVSHHLKLAGVEGFATSLGGFVVLPVAMPVNVFLFYVLATRMTASIAALRGYDLTQQEIRTATLLTLVGADAQDLLAKAGVATKTGAMTNLAAQRLPGPALMVVNKAVGFRILSLTGRKTLARMGKAVPVAGGAVGAGLDMYLLNKIADNARKEFPQR